MKKIIQIKIDQKANTDKKQRERESEERKVMSEPELVCSNGHFTIPKLKKVADSPTRPDFSSGKYGTLRVSKSQSSLMYKNASLATSSPVVVSTKTQTTQKKTQQQKQQRQQLTAHRRSKSLTSLQDKKQDFQKGTSKEEGDGIEGVKEEDSGSKVVFLDEKKEGKDFQKEFNIQPTSKRDNIVFEVFTTERTYVGLLKITIDEFFEPLKKANPPLIPEAHLTKIFSILEDIYLTNSKLLEDLEKRMTAWNPDTQKIGDLFCTFAPFLKMYALYVSNYDDATALLESYEKIPAVKTWLSDKYHEPHIKVLSLQSLLILPVQRIPRYCLLLKDLVKHTPETHPDFLDLQSSLKVILEIADQINEDVKRRENRQKLLKLQASLTSFTTGFDVKKGYILHFMFISSLEIIGFIHSFEI